MVSDLGVRMRSLLAACWQTSQAAHLQLHIVQLPGVWCFRSGASCAPGRMLPGFRPPVCIKRSVCCPMVAVCTNGAPVNLALTLNSIACKTGLRGRTQPWFDMRRCMGAARAFGGAQAFDFTPDELNQKPGLWRIVCVPGTAFNPTNQSVDPSGYHLLWCITARF